MIALQASKQYDVSYHIVLVDLNLSRSLEIVKAVIQAKPDVTVIGLLGVAN